MALSGEPIFPPGALNNVTFTVSGWSWVGLSNGTTGTFKELAPAGIVTEVPIGTKSDPLVAVPVTCRFTVKGWAVLPVRVMVKVPDFGPDSIAMGSVAWMLTTLASSSWIV